MNLFALKSPAHVYQVLAPLGLISVPSRYSGEVGVAIPAVPSAITMTGLGVLARREPLHPGKHILGVVDRDLVDEIVLKDGRVSQAVP